MTGPGPVSAILCADWGKESSKRAVYVADVRARVVRRLVATAWTVDGVLNEAQRWTSIGSVLATFDAPLGVPESYLAAVGRVSSWRAPTTFLDFLGWVAHSRSLYFEGTSVAADWKIERPFFAVPAGEGGLDSYRQAAARHGVNLYRHIDHARGAKTLFAKSGVPGSVGSSACALWRELAPRLTPGREFQVWPFDGDLPTLLASSPVVVGEIYPRAAYASALLDALPMSRAPLIVAKTDAVVRHKAIEALLAAKWVRSLGVTVENVAEAETSEDDFDACVTAAALLRCVLEQSALCPVDLVAAPAEGGMLGTGSVNLQLRPRTFGNPGRKRDRVVSTLHPCRLVQAKAPDVQGGTRIFRCPIADCDKVYRGSRGGWDGHVGSLRLHSRWHPELTSADARKRQYEIEFPDFFA